MKGVEFNFDYRYTLDKSNPGFVAGRLDPPAEKQCLGCGITFRGKSRLSKRCPPCQKIADARSQARSLEKSRLTRAKKRAAEAAAAKGAA